AENRHDRRAYSRGDVHRAAIVAHEEVATFDERRGLVDIGAPRQVQQAITLPYQGFEPVGNLNFVWPAKHYYCCFVGEYKLSRHGCESLDGPDTCTAVPARAGVHRHERPGTILATTISQKCSNFRSAGGVNG